MWEAVVMLVLLKIPVVYLSVVLWIALRSEPVDQPPAAPVLVSDTPPAPEPGAVPARRHRTPVRPGPARRPRSPRPATTRAEVPR